MSRCVICDHFEGHGSDYNIFSKPFTKVRWRSNSKQYECDDCYEIIGKTIDDWKVEDSDTIPFVTVDDDFDSKKQTY